MSTLLGFVIIIGQIIGTVIVFGGWKDCPTWLKITSGIAQIWFFIAYIALAMK